MKNPEFINQVVGLTFKSLIPYRFLIHVSVEKNSNTQLACSRLILDPDYLDEYVGDAFDFGQNVWLFELEKWFLTLKIAV